MTSLLPDAIKEAITSRSVFGASESFGLVVLILAVVLLVEWEVLGVTRGRQGRPAALSAAALPLVAVFLLVALARIIELL